MHPLDSVSPVRTKEGKIPTADGTLHPSHPRMTSGSGDHPPRPPSSASTASSASSSSSRHVKCIGRYVLLAETLGKGNFARVEAAVHTLTKSRVAIKIIETDKIKEEYVKKNLLREAQLMRRLRHPNIIRLYETMKTNTLYCLVTEVAEGGELLSHVRNDCPEKRLSEGSARMFVRQLISALDYLHNAGIVHRDLKMENILLDKRKKSIKIVDFGLSNAQRPGALLQTHCGSPEYAAPELFIPGREYGPEVDVWSLGVNMYAMLVGKLPFRSPRQGTKRRQKLLEQISSGLTENHYKEMEHLSAGAVDLIAHLLQPNPAKRARLFETMGHPWITRDGLQPLEPYKQPAIDHSLQTAVMELMSSAVEVSVAEIRETVRRDRCDWLAAIFNLLIEYPEGRAALQKTQVNDEDRGRSLGNSQESLNGTSGFSQGLSQDVLDLTEAGLIQPAKKAHPRIVDHSRPASESQYGPAAKEKRRSASHSQGERLAYDINFQASSSRYVPTHRPSCTAPSLAIRRASMASPLASPEHLSVPSGRRLPQTPSPDRDETVSPTHVRRESAPKPLPQPFRASIATQNELYANGKPRRYLSQTGDNDLSHAPKTSKPVYSPTPSPMTRLVAPPDSEQGDLKHHGGSRKVLSPIRPKSTVIETSNAVGRHHGLMKDGINDQAMYTAWKGHKRHVVAPKYQSGAGRHPVDSSQIPIPNGWSAASSSMYGGSLRKLSPAQQDFCGGTMSTSDNIHQSLKDLRQHPASHMTPENEHGMSLMQEVNGSTNRSDLELVTDMFAPRGPYGPDPHSMPLSQDSGMMLKGEPSFEGRLRKQKSMDQLKRSLPRPKTVSLSSSISHSNGDIAMCLMSPSESRTMSSHGKHQRLPSIEELQTKRPHSSRSRSISGFLGRALKITSFKSKSGDK